VAGYSAVAPVFDKIMFCCPSDATAATLVPVIERW